MKINMTGESNEISCFDCLRPGHYCDHVECDDIPEDWNDDGQYNELEMPRKCGKYLPLPTGKCSCCDIPLTGYFYQHKLWFEQGECFHPLCQGCFDNVPDDELSINLVCSC